MARCEIDTGQAYKESPNHIRSIKEALQKNMPLLEAVKSIMEDEKSLSAECVTLLHSKVRLIEEDSIAIRRILEDIAADEEKRQELLQMIVDLIAR